MLDVLDSLNFLIYVFLFLSLSNLVYLAFLGSKIPSSYWILFNSFIVLIGSLVLLFNTGILVDEIGSEGSELASYSTLCMIGAFMISIPFAFKNKKKGDWSVNTLNQKSIWYDIRARNKSRERWRMNVNLRSQFWDSNVLTWWTKQRCRTSNWGQSFVHLFPFELLKVYKTRSLLIDFTV